jgi:hypothetical protein
MPQTIPERIAEIDAILAQGVSVLRHADRTIEYDLAALRLERAHLLQQQVNAASPSGGFRRVVFRHG